MLANASVSRDYVAGIPTGSSGPACDMLDDLFSVDRFTADVNIALSRLAGYLGDRSVRGLTLTDPALVMAAASKLTRNGSVADAAMHGERLAAILDLYARTGIPVYSPGYMGRQFSGPLPVSAVVDLASAILTQPASFYEAGPLPSVAERIMGEELNRYLGLPADRFTMVTTSGGSLANLTALLAARGQRYPDVWTDGLAGLDRRPAIGVGEDSHYSVQRAAGVLGLGEAQVVRLPLDTARRIDPARAATALDAAAARGLDVFALVATAGTTPVGAIDPLGALADLAAERGLWLHVDAAHGGGMIVSDRLRHRMAGIERADSIAWDAHKTMFVPAACTMLFYRERDHAHAAFRQEASYVFEKAPDRYTEFDAAEKNFECTKRPMIMTLWVPWALYGPAPFAEKIEGLCDMAVEVHAMLRAQQDFVPLHRPDSNILCFRYVPARRMDAATLGALQGEIRNRVRARGHFFISKVDLDGQPVLRLVFMNHLVTTEHVGLLLEEIRTVAEMILEEQA